MLDFLEHLLEAELYVGGRLSSRQELQNTVMNTMEFLLKNHVLEYTQKRKCRETYTMLVTVLSVAFILQVPIFVMFLVKFFNQSGISFIMKKDIKLTKR